MKINYKIKFSEGFHSRPALELIDLSKENKELNIRITKINETEQDISCKNLIAILKANIEYGNDIEITYEDSNKNEIIYKKLNRIFNGNYGI